MRIIEAQNAVLTNFEVSQFLQQRSVQQAKEHRKRGLNKDVENLLKVVLSTLNKGTSPLSQQPTRYSSEAIRDLIGRLQSFRLTKAEMIMLINTRPQTHSMLHCCIEEIGSRLNDDEQQAILDAIAEVLGNFPPKAEEGDVEMDDDLGSMGPPTPPANANGTR